MRLTFAPLQLGKEDERILLIPDVHRPFHNKRAWDALIRFAKSWRPHTIAFTGDYVDMYTVSAHDRDPRRIHQLDDEVADGNVGLDEVEAVKPRRVIFCSGNHEYRLERYLLQHAPALLSTTNIESLLKFKQRGWSHVPYRKHAKLGNLYMTHDVGYSGVNAVRQTGAAFRHNIAFGHSHRLALNYFGSVTGDRYVSANLGWLGDAGEASYAHEATKADWQLGFGIVTMRKNGQFEIQLKPIVDGRIVY